MVKKKLIGLSTLLLVLLLGLFTTSYAKTLTATDFKNFYANAYRYNTNQNPSQTILDRLENMTSVFETWATYTETYEGQWLLAYDKSNSNMNFYYITGSIQNLLTHQMYYYNNQIYVNTSYLTGYRGIFRASDNYYSQIGRNAEVTIGANPYLYTDRNVKANVNGENNPNATNKYVAGQSVPNENLFAENYFSNRANWGVAEHLYDEVTVQGWNVQAYINSIYQSYFGGYGTSLLEDGWSTALFGGLDEYLSSEVDLYRYDRQSNTWYKSMSTSDRVKIYGQDTQSNTFYFYLGITPYWSDSVAILTLHHKTNPLLDYEVLLYLMSDSTVIDSSGYISMTGTINNYNYSGDNGYVNNTNTINNQNDTQSIVDTLTDDSQVDGILGQYSTSGEILNAMGYTEHANPYHSLVITVIQQICDVLLDDANPYFDYSMHGEAPTRIYASQFTTSETPLKVFIRLSLIFGALYVTFVQFKEVIDLINSGNGAKVLQMEDADVYFYKM